MSLSFHRRVESRSGEARREGGEKEGRIRRSVETDVLCFCDVWIVVLASRILLLTGSQGSGKTTLAKALGLRLEEDERTLASTSYL